MAASFVVSHVEALDERLPMVAAVLAADDTDWHTVQLIITRTELVHGDAIPLVDADLADRITKDLLVPRHIRIEYALILASSPGCGSRSGDFLHG